MSQEVYVNIEEVRGQHLNAMMAVDIDDDIYINVEATKPETRNQDGRQHSVRPQRWKSRSGAAAVCLGLLCLLLLAGIIGQVVNYVSVTGHHHYEMQSIQSNYKNLSKERIQLQTSYNNLAKEQEQLQSSYDMAQMMGRCSQGWQKIGCSFYCVSSEKKTWEESRQYCEARGADLWIINNKAEQERLGSALQLNRKNRIWIGLTDKMSEGQWKWVDGTDLEGDGFWREGEPNNHEGGENCVELLQGGRNDLPCSSELYYICEI